MRVTTDDGVDLAVIAAGEGPGLVLVHGFGGAKEDFTDHLDALAATHRVVTFDHRGHGASGKPDHPSAYSFARLESDILAVADACDLDRFRLLGHSMGGMIVRGVAIRNPDRIDALVLMDTSHGPVPGMDPSLMDFGAEVALNEGKDVLKELLDAAMVLETPAYQRLLRDRPGYQEFVDRKWESLSAVMWGALVREIAHQPDDIDALRALTCPTLVIVGEQDEPFLGPSRAITEAIVDSRLVVVSDAGHSPQFENPMEWFAALDGFLASLPEPAGRA